MTRADDDVAAAFAVAQTVARSLAAEPSPAVRKLRFDRYVADLDAPAYPGLAWLGQRLVGAQLNSRGNVDLAAIAADVLQAAGRFCPVSADQVEWWLQMCARGFVVGGDVLAVTPHALRVLGVPDREWPSDLQTPRSGDGASVHEVYAAWGDELAGLARASADAGPAVTLVAAGGLVRAMTGRGTEAFNVRQLPVTAACRLTVPDPLRRWWHLNVDAATTRVRAVDEPPGPQALLPRWAYAGDIDMFGDDVPRWVTDYAATGTISYPRAREPRPVLDPATAVDIAVAEVDRVGLGSAVAVEHLVAVRLPVGYRVYVPRGATPITSAVLGGAIFYVADDGVLWRASGSVPPSMGARRLREDFLRRHDYDNTTADDLWSDDVVGADPS